MKFILIKGLVLLLILCACQANATKSGLKIAYKPTRGQSYTDAQGTSLNLRHIPATITNDSSLSIHIEIAFAEQYNYPPAFDDKQFRIFPMPEIWAMDGIDITDSILRELPPYMDNPSLSKTLKPGETWYLAFGTLYPKNINYGVFPIAVFSQDQRDLQHECKNQINPEELPISPLSLELLIGFTDGSQASPDSCISLPFAQISYPEE